MERFVSLGVLASGLHHEIKNPLTALSIHVQLLEKRLGDPASRMPVDELIRRAEETEMLAGSTALLDGFRDFASLHRVLHRAARRRPFDILEETVRLIGPQADQQHVEVILRRPEAGLPRVPLDSDKFKQAVLNLVINALEAMPGGGGARPAGPRRWAASSGSRSATPDRGSRPRSNGTCSSPTSPPRPEGPAWGWPSPRRSSASTGAGSISGRVPRARHSASPSPWSRPPAAGDEPRVSSASFRILARRGSTTSGGQISDPGSGSRSKMSPTRSRRRRMRPRPGPSSSACPISS